MYLEIKHCLFYLYIICICNLYLCSYFSMRKIQHFYLCPLWPKLAFDHHGHLIIPYTDWLHHSVSSPPVSLCVVGILAHYGCRRIIQVDAAHRWLRRFPPLYVKCFKYPEKRYINVTNYYYKYLPFILLLP